ncbi:MAG: DUF493 domain-containing protein [Bacteriovoracaceae bacterium]
MTFNAEKFRLILENEYKWPSPYLFKFIVPVDQVENLKEVFLGHEVDLKKSRKGNYVSLSCRRQINETQEVIELYLKASKVKGCISL